MTIKMQNMMFNHTLSSVPRLFVLSSIMLVGLAMSSCSSSDDPASQGTGAEGNSPATNTGIALNNLNADILQASVKSFTRGEVPEQEISSVCTPAFAPATSDNGLTCDVAWSTSATTRASDTGYNLQWGSIGSATQIAIQPRAYAATSYSTYNVSTSGNISASSPYYFESATDDVITSWYPYNSGSLSSFTVQTNQSVVANYIASDLLYTSQTVNAASQSLTYSHKMAQVIVDVTVSNANYLTNSEIQTLTIAGLKTNCTTDFTSFSGNVVRDLTFTTTDASSGDIKAYRYSNSSTSTTSTATFILCVPAQTIATTQTFTVTVGGTAYTGKLTTAQTLASGSAYNISIGITAEKIRYIGRTSSTYAIGDFYCKYVNGQAAIVANSSTHLTTAKNKGCVPIAVIFLTSTSTTDTNNGWSGGYAVALQNATTGNGANGTCIWGLTGTNANPLNSVDYTIWKDYWDGYTYTHNIGSNSNYPAIYYALKYNETVPAPPSSSLWYLPSNGQWFYIFYNLCNKKSHKSYGTIDYMGWEGVASSGAANINAYFTTAQGYGADIYTMSSDHGTGGGCEDFWTSSNSSNANFAHMARFNFGANNLHIWTDNTSQGKKDTWTIHVRPVLAF